jgi:hypothetical protein
MFGITRRRRIPKKEDKIWRCWSDMKSIRKTPTTTTRTETNNIFKVKEERERSEKLDLEFGIVHVKRNWKR